MAPTVSKTTSEQLEYSAAVESATAEHGERIAQKVMKLVWGAETPPVSLVVVVRALLALLQVASRTLRTGNAAGDPNPNNPLVNGPTGSNG